MRRDVIVRQVVEDLVTEAARQHNADASDPVAWIRVLALSTSELNCELWKAAAVCVEHLDPESSVLPAEGSAEWAGQALPVLFDLVIARAAETGRLRPRR